jgi:hypothetical protein
MAASKLSFDAVFEAIRAAGVPSDMRLEQAHEMACTYAALLEGMPADMETVADLDDLPYAKEAIKHALLMLLRLVPRPVLREPLKIAYVRLGQWQSRIVAPAIGIDIANPRTAGNPLTFASQLAANKAPIEEKRRAAAKAERSALIAELRRLGFE